ncbi:MAG: RNHCP domain-containing protein [bacterium]
MKKFTRTKEDFKCDHCGQKATGNGYTNHCPKCLWSRHVDVNPGDRQASCVGMMEPIDVIIKKGSYIIVHQCVDCGAVKRNKASLEDDRQVIITLSAHTAVTR